jgi:hypothetical protein
VNAVRPMDRSDLARQNSGGCWYESLLWLDNSIRKMPTFPYSTTPVNREMSL